MKWLLVVIAMLFLFSSGCRNGMKYDMEEKTWSAGCQWYDTLDRSWYGAFVPYPALEVKNYSVDKINDIYGEPYSVEKKVLIDGRPQVDFLEVDLLYDNMHPDTASKYFRGKECIVYEYTWRSITNTTGDSLFLCLYYLDSCSGLIQLWGYEEFDNVP